jgi:hypothetical protein
VKPFSGSWFVVGAVGSWLLPTRVLGMVLFRRRGGSGEMFPILWMWWKEARRFCEVGRRGSFLIEGMGLWVT